MSCLSYEAILNGDDKSAVAVAREALAANADPIDPMTATMVPARDEVGTRAYNCRLRSIAMEVQWLDRIKRGLDSLADDETKLVGEMMDQHGTGFDTSSYGL